MDLYRESSKIEMKTRKRISESKLTSTTRNPHEISCGGGTEQPDEIGQENESEKAYKDRGCNWRTKELILEAEKHIPSN